MNSLYVKRAYAEPEKADGFRFLVDRLWPRGITKQRAALEAWKKELAPSNELRRQFHSGSICYEEFRQRYISELNLNQASFDFAETCADLLKKDNITLIYAARTEDQNHALILRDWLQEAMAGRVQKPR